MPAGRPPLAGSSAQGGDEEEYDQQYEEGEENANQQQYEEGEENEEDANNNNNGENEERQAEEEEESEADSEDVVQYVGPPEEKPFPSDQCYIFDLGAALAESVANTISNNAAANSSTTQSPAAKQAAVTAAVESTTRKLQVTPASQNDPRFPKWLHYILNDDYPSLSYLVHPPPGAEIDLTTATGNQNNNNNNEKNKKNKNNKKFDDGEDYDEENPDEMSRPSTGRDSQQLDDEDLYDSEGNPRSRNGDGGAGEYIDDIEFHPNEKFLLIPSEEKPNQIWNLLPYDLPKPAAFLGNRPESGMSGQESARSGQTNGEGDESQMGDSTAADPRDQDNNNNNENQNGDNNNNVDQGEDQADATSGIVIDVLVLAALFSPQSFAMCLAERKKQLKNDPEDQKKPQYDEDGNLMVDEEENEEEIPYEDMDDETLRKKLRSPPSLRCFWKFCERHSGGAAPSSTLFSGECAPLNLMITSQSTFNSSDDEIIKKYAPSSKKKKANKKLIDEETGEEYYENDEDDNEKKFDPNEETATEKKMTRAQKRRLFLDYGRIFDIIAAAPSTSAAQFLEKSLELMIVNANISPDSPIDIKSRALKNVNTLHAYVTLMENIPRSVVTENTQLWLEPVPLTEEEVNAYPEGAENIPDEHPPKIPPTLWKIFQQVRRRNAKDSRGKEAPKRPLLEVIKKFFTPQTSALLEQQQQPAVIDSNTHTATKSKGLPAVIHSDKFHPTYDEEFDDLAKTIDPCLSTDFDAHRDYLPNKLAVYLSDIVLVLLSRHEFAADTFKWLGELKRDFPHAKWDPVSSSHILAFSLNRMESINSFTTVSTLLEPQWLSNHGRIDSRSFTSEILSVEKAAECPLATGSFFVEKLKTQETFASRFAGTFLSSSSARSSSSSEPQKLLKQIEAENPELHALFTAMENSRKKFEKMLMSYSESEILQKKGFENSLKDIIADLGFRSRICTPSMLKIAVDHNNVTATRFLIQIGGVTRVSHERGTVPVLEYAIETRNEAIVLALIEDYSNVHEPLRGGQRDLLAELQHTFVPPPNAKKIFFFEDEHSAQEEEELSMNLSQSNADFLDTLEARRQVRKLKEESLSEGSPAFLDLMASVKKVEAAIREAEAKRGADPKQLLGIRVGSKV